MEEKKPETKNEDKATADNVRGSEIVLPASMAQTPRAVAATSSHPSGVRSVA